MFLKNFKIDTSRAREFWPRHVNTLEELPAPYRPHVAEWMEQGMPISQVIFVRQTNHWVTEKPEYVLAWMGRRLLYIQKQPLGGVAPTVIEADTIFYALYSHRLLDNRMTIGYSASNEPQTIMLHFNAATEELFYPVFELLLRNSFTQPSEARSKNQADTIVSLQEKTFKMCSYLDFVYRFDDTILAYYWDKNITPEQQKRNAKSLKRIEDTEYLAALMGRGLALEKIAENAIDVAYLFRSAVGEASVVSSAQGELSLCFPCVSGESFFVPVKPENRRGGGVRTKVQQECEHFARQINLSARGQPACKGFFRRCATGISLQKTHDRTNSVMRFLVSFQMSLSGNSQNDEVVSICQPCPFLWLSLAACESVRHWRPTGALGPASRAYGQHTTTAESPTKTPPHRR